MPVVVMPVGICKALLLNSALAMEIGGFRYPYTRRRRRRRVVVVAYH